MEVKKGVFDIWIWRGVSIICLLLLTLIWISPSRKTDSKPVKTLGLTSEDSLEIENLWLDSMLASMTLDEKIGQLFTIRAHSNLSQDHIKSVEQQIQKYHVGGLCFFQGTAAKQLELTNRYQAMSKIPLLISMDAEWGLSMRLKDSIMSFPRNLMLGAIPNSQWLYDYGRVHAAQLKRIGVHVNFAPVIDINNNPQNPVINDRSFGEDKFNVVTKSYMYMIGLQDEGIMACGKHFPGHGDTQVDSHYDLPVINHSRERMEETELFPFDLLCENGLQSVMVAHVHVPALDSTPNMPTSLSPAVVDTLLRRSMGYDGLVFTDALEMKGVTKYYKPGEIELRALMAGNDVLLLPEDIDIAFKTLKNALESGLIKVDRLEESVRRILRAKYRLGIGEQASYPKLENLYQDLNHPDFYAVKENIMAEALTLVKDQFTALPLLPSKLPGISFVHIGCEAPAAFMETAEWYGQTRHHVLPPVLTDELLSQCLGELDTSQWIVITLHAKKRVASANYGLDPKALAFVEQLQQRFKNRLVFAFFGNPYGLRYFEKLPVVIAAYEDDPMAYSLFVQALFGARSFVGKLPVKVSDEFPLYSGKKTQLSGVLRLSTPEAVGMHSGTLARIDTIMAEMIKIKASPGAQIMAIKDQSVVWNKAYGTHTYDKQSPAVLRSDLYDVASVTKVTASTLAIMKLYEDGLLDLDKPISEYLPLFKGSNKEFITLREILLHKAGLTPWIPFYKQTVSKKNGGPPIPDSLWFRTSADSNYMPVADHLWLKKSYIDTILTQIRDSPLLPDKSYKYSDLGFILIPFIVEAVSGMRMDAYLDKYFYKPLGLRYTFFNPKEKIKTGGVLVPTENDNYFRNQLLVGHVHDMAAAMLGGVSGHAGLFSNTRDLGILFSMLVNGGFYQGKRYLKEETIDYFTTRPEGESRRGLGFDMIQLQKGKAVNVTGLASSRTFGHTGFTGTCVWADPECGIIYIFLSNRVYPSMENTKINDYQYRLRVHYHIYQSLIP
jgi:beta-N-acetylhexosaminidase